MKELMMKELTMKELTMIGDGGAVYTWWTRLKC
jgi:hypothetical protein